MTVIAMCDQNTNLFLTNYFNYTNKQLRLHTIIKCYTLLKEAGSERASVSVLCARSRGAAN